jgi:uncharacterized membrane protein YtjA (UPF0391 family)
MTPDKAASLWKYQSQLLWNRIKTASIIEAGTLGATHALSHDEKWQNTSLPCAVLFFSSLLLFCVILLMGRDHQYLETFRSIADFRKPEPSPKGFSGINIGICAICVSIVFNIVVALVYLDCPCFLSNWSRCLLGF